MKKDIETRNEVAVAVVTDLAPGSQLKASRRALYSLVGAQFPAEMSKEQLFQQLENARIFQRAARIIISDGLRHARKEFGEEVQDEFIAKLGLDDKEVEELSLISSVPFNLRSLLLIDDHYVILGDAIAQEKITKDDLRTWIVRAEENTLTPGELKDSIAAGKVVRHDRSLGLGPTTNRTALVLIQSIGTSFKRFKKQLEERDSPLESMDAEYKRQIFEEIRPIGETYEQLKADLGEPAETKK